MTSTAVQADAGLRLTDDVPHTAAITNRPAVLVDVPNGAASRLLDGGVLFCLVGSQLAWVVALGYVVVRLVT